MRKVIFTLIIALITGLGPAYGNVSVSQAQNFVQNLRNQTLGSGTENHDSMKKIGMEKFNQVVKKDFALDIIARFVLGRTWRTLTPKQRQNYQHVFTEYVLVVYDHQISQYGSFNVVLSGHPVPVGRGDILVMTKAVTDRSTQPVEIGWRVSRIRGKLKIVDVVIEGVSMLQTQRSEFSSVVRQNGFQGLMKQLKAKVKQLNSSS